MFNRITHAVNADSIFISIYTTHLINYLRKKKKKKQSNFPGSLSIFLHHLRPSAIWYGQIRVADDSY